MKISLIICTRDRAHLLQTCLQSLSQHSNELHEVIVIDQSSDTAANRSTVEKLSPVIRNLKYIYTETRGASRARNLGVKTSTGDIIAFTDDDCIITSGWAETINQEFQKDGDIMAVYGKVLPFFNGKQPSKVLAIQLNNNRQEYKKLVNPWKFLSGNNTAFRREVFAKVGYFDELLGPGAELKASEDADLAYRLLRHGLKIIYNPEIVIYHQQWREGAERWQVEKDYNIGAGAFFIKHLRYGDVYAFKLIFERVLQLGLGNIILAALSFNKYRLRKGYIYFFCAAQGMWKGLMKPLSLKYRVFATPDS